MAGNITEVSSVAGSSVSTDEVSATSSTDSSAAPAAAAEDYVVIDKQSAIEAMAYFIAETLMSCPQAASLPPAKLQAAVLVAIQVGWQVQRIFFLLHVAHEQAVAKCHALMQPLDTCQFRPGLGSPPRSNPFSKASGLPVYSSLLMSRAVERSSEHQTFQARASVHKPGPSRKSELLPPSACRA